MKAEGLAFKRFNANGPCLAHQQGPSPMIWEYLAGELSIRLEQLQAATDAPDSRLAHLRQLVEDGPEAELDAELACALALADRICWDSVSGRHRRVRAAGAHLREPAPARRLRGADR